MWFSCVSVFARHFAILSLVNESDPSDNSADAKVAVSKSERKRQAEWQKSLGKRLCELSAEHLHDVAQSQNLPDELLSAIADYQHIRSNSASKRQLQFIGKLMRSLDSENIAQAIDQLDGASAQDRYVHHQLEQWRERLLHEPQALTEYLDAFPNSDRQQLRHHLQRAKGAKNDEQRRGAERTLFRFLRDNGQDAQI